ISSEKPSPVRTEGFRGSLKVSQRDPRPSLAMTSVLRIRRRHCLSEGNLGLSKPSYDEKAGAGNFLLLGDFRDGLSTKRCTGGYDPIAPFTVFGGAPARSIDLTT